jgi:hypothetical protein
MCVCICVWMCKCARIHYSFRFFLMVFCGNQHTQPIKKKGKTCKKTLSPHTHLCENIVCNGHTLYLSAHTYTDTLYLSRSHARSHLTLSLSRSHALALSRSRALARSLFLCLSLSNVYAWIMMRKGCKRKRK